MCRYSTWLYLAACNKLLSDVAAQYSALRCFSKEVELVDVVGNIGYECRSSVSLLLVLFVKDELKEVKLNSTNTA